MFVSKVHKHIHVETEPNCSHELATFLEYHMPLKREKEIALIS